MLTVRIENDEIITEGEVKEGDIYPGFCCAGHDWEVSLIFPDRNPAYTTIYGGCHNPDCPDTDGSEFDFWRGVSDCSQEDFIIDLAEGRSRFPAKEPGPVATGG